jgi:hypothetical protein
MWILKTVNFVIGDTKNQPTFGAQNVWKTSDQMSVTGAPSPICSGAPMETWVNGGRWEPLRETELPASPWTTNTAYNGELFIHFWLGQKGFRMESPSGI